MLRQQYVEAARSIGMSDGGILLREILPNVVTPCWSKRRSRSPMPCCSNRRSAFSASAQPPEPSWGNMLNTGRGFMAQAPWLGIVPGMAMFLCVLGFNLLGDGLRDFFDPHLGTEPGGRGGRMRCPAAPTLQIEALGLEYAGRRGVARRVSLEVWPREIVGLIGDPAAARP